MNATQGENVDVPGAAKWLGVSKRTVSQLVADDAIPHFRVGKQIRFHLPQLREWAKQMTERPYPEGIAWADDEKLLKFLLGQFQMHSPQVTGEHGWRFRNGGWPMTHCKGPTIKQALAKVLAEIEREGEKEQKENGIKRS